MSELRTKSAISQWIPALIVGLAIGLTGCQATPTTEPIPTPSPPEAPVIELGDETTVEPGKTIAVRASAAGASRYEWKLDGPGQISTQGPEPVTRYTAPEEGGVISALTVVACNDWGASRPTSLIINVLPIVTATVPLDALAFPFDWISPNPDAFVSLERGSEAICYTGSDCLRITYRPGGELGGIQWWPLCIHMRVAVNCQEVRERSQVFYGGQVCIASIQTPKGTCSIDVLKVGHLSKVNHLTFWARGDQGREIVTFGIGGADVLPIPSRPLWVTLTNTWKRYEIDLEGLDLTNASILFFWLAKDIDNPQGAIFYLDDIQFEGNRMKIAATQPPHLSQHAEQHLAALFTRLCWVAYSPTHFDPTTTPIRWPSEDDVREDLRVLRSAGFNGLVTYGSNYASQDASDQMLDIPRLAQEAGFEGMIVGVWDPTDENELQAAEQTSHYPVVVGYSVGNEGLDVHYNLETLVSAMDRLRRNTGKPVSTTEEAHDYYEDSPLWSMSDWIFPNVHPYFAGYRDPEEAVEWTEKIFETLDLVSNKPLIFKEVGLPSGGDLNLDESRQAQYYQLLRETSVTYVVFEAFDAPWKHLGRQNPDGTYSWPDPEPHWGIFTSARVPKEAAINICSAQ